MTPSFAQMSRVPQHPHARHHRAAKIALVIVLTFPFAASARTPVPTQDLETAQAAILRAEAADAEASAAPHFPPQRASITALSVADGRMTAATFASSGW